MTQPLPVKLRVGDALFRNYAGRISILLDGAELRDCVAFDCAAGFVTVNRRDQAGHIVLEAGEIARETRRGKVEVRWK